MNFFVYKYELKKIVLLNKMKGGRQKKSIGKLYQLSYPLLSHWSVLEMVCILQQGSSSN